MIALENTKTKHGDDLPQTLHEWGAWRAYFSRISARQKLIVMERLKFYMVPAQWPHLFAVGETPELDYSAGNAFAQTYGDRRAKAKDYGSAAEKQATVAAARAKFPMGKRSPVTPESHLEVLKKTFNDPEALERLVKEAGDGL